MKQALTRILAAPVSESVWQEAKLPTHLSGMGLRSALDHAPAAYAASLLASQPLVKSILGNPELSELALKDWLLTKIIMAFNDPGVFNQDQLMGLNQKQISLQIDLHNKTKLMELAQQQENENQRFLSQLVSNNRLHAGDWLNAVPNPALGLYLQPQEFSFCAKY